MFSVPTSLTDIEVELDSASEPAGKALHLYPRELNARPTARYALRPTAWY